MMRRRFLVTIALVLVIIAGAEASLRFASAKLREPLVWGNWEAQNKVAAMDRIAEGGRRASVVVVGSSMANVAADPAALGRTLGAGSLVFNAALGGADVRSLELWTRDVVVPRLRPARVVIGLSSRELNDGGISQSRFYEKLTTSPEGSRLRGGGGIGLALERWFGARSALIKYRTVLRHPMDLTGQDPLQAAYSVDPLGVTSVFYEVRTRPYALTARLRRVFEENTLNDFSVGGSQLAALDRLIAALRSRDVAVTLVQMPVLDQYVALHAQREDFAAFQRVITRYAHDSGVQYVDMRSAIGNDTRLFVDPVHMNQLGSELFSRLLGQALLDPSAVPTEPGAVWSGSIVTVRNSDGTEERILVAASAEERTSDARTVTSASPLGSSLVGKRPGDEVVVPSAPTIPDATSSPVPQPVATYEVISVTPWDGKSK